MKKNSIFLIAIGILISIFRLYIDKINSEDLIFIMAIINTVAFDYVILIIVLDIEKNINDMILKSTLPVEQQEKCKKNVNLILQTTNIIIFIMFSIIYIIFLRSGALNDILAIMSLMISICQEQISDYFSKLIYLKI